MQAFASVFAVAFNGQVIAGGVTSFNVNVAVQVVVLPVPSVEVMVTTWVALCADPNVLPAAGLCVKTCVQLSDATVEAVRFGTVPAQVPASIFTF